VKVLDHYENPRNVGALDKKKRCVPFPLPSFALLVCTRSVVCVFAPPWHTERGHQEQAHHFTPARGLWCESRAFVHGIVAPVTRFSVSLPDFHRAHKNRGALTLSNHLVVSHTIGKPLTRVVASATSPVRHAVLRRGQ
jgi:hypothetical protein